LTVLLKTPSNCKYAIICSFNKLHNFRFDKFRSEEENALKIMKEFHTFIKKEFVVQKPIYPHYSAGIKANKKVEESHRMILNGNTSPEAKVSKKNKSAPKNSSSSSGESKEEKKAAKSAKKNKSPDEVKEVVIENGVNVKENKLSGDTVCKGCGRP
jgi:hypothetical protein